MAKCRSQLWLVLSARSSVAVIFAEVDVEYSAHRLAAQVAENRFAKALAAQVTAEESRRTP